jgi:hypothetical protein
VATQQRSRPRRQSSSRHRGPRHVEAVLDPTWQNPYTPSVAEREGHLGALRHFVMRTRRPEILVAGVVVVALLVGVVYSPWCLVVAVAVAGLVGWDVRRALVGVERRGSTLAAEIHGVFRPAGTPKERQRLTTVIDRLSATFGVDAVVAEIIDDPGYNAALVPTDDGYTFFVTSALMDDFELIELEGVVAHCLARQRLGILSRQCASTSVRGSVPSRRELAGVGLTYRADEVAAAAIRYPLGLAGALRKCARQVVAPASFFSSSTYDRWRFIWFDVWSDRSTPDLSDLDDVELRAQALEEW